MRQTGILMPLFSLPSPWGVGELGSGAYRWLDLLHEMRVTVWQLLPLNPVGYGNSPYQPYSSFAGDEIYISLEQLYKDGLLKNLPPAFAGGEKRVRYEEVRAFKEPYLREAFAAFSEGEEYASFAKQPWVYPYGIFRAFKSANGLRCWNQWPKEQKDWSQESGRDQSGCEAEARYHMFLQYQFCRQWMSVKRYANERQIEIMGDVPFYVGLDSVDVWAGKKNFLLDQEGNPTFIAGVPPDYFSATGQRWGNPIYDWDYQKNTDFRFWVERLGYSARLFDVIRIDHFRAFDTFWKIPSSCPTAQEGEWIEAPGYEVLDTVVESLPGIHLVAEDLGELRPEVGVLKEHYHLKGMKILQFTLGTDGKYAFDGQADKENLIVYTGTHDNATTREWYDSLSAAARRKLRRYLKRRGFSSGSPVRRLVECALLSRADYVVIPAFDFLEEGSSARLNTPGTVGAPNWEWRLDSMERFRKALSGYRTLIARRSETAVNREGMTDVR